MPSDRRYQPESGLLDENISVYGYEFALTQDSVEIVATPAIGSENLAGASHERGGEEFYITFHPTSKRQAHQLSRALRRCSIRLTAFAENLPLEPEPK